MTKCGKCDYFRKISKGADDYEEGKGDCVMEKKDEKGKFWISRPVFEDTESCLEFKKKIHTIATS